MGRREGWGDWASESEEGSVSRWGGGLQYCELVKIWSKSGKKWVEIWAAKRYNAGQERPVKSGDTMAVKSGDTMLVKSGDARSGDAGQVIQTALSSSRPATKACGRGVAHRDGASARARAKTARVRARPAGHGDSGSGGRAKAPRSGA